MIASVVKRKLVYVLHRDGSGAGGAAAASSTPTPNGNGVVLASPLEAHRPRTVVFDAVGVDNGYDNPIFVCLEVQYPEMEDSVLIADERRRKIKEEEEKNGWKGSSSGDKDEAMEDAAKSKASAHGVLPRRRPGGCRWSFRRVGGRGGLLARGHGRSTRSTRWKSEEGTDGPSHNVRHTQSATPLP